MGIETVSANVSESLAKVRRLERDRNVPGLIELLGNPLEASRRVTVRGAAAMALGEIGDRAAVPYLIELLGDQRPVVRSLATYALRQIGDERAANSVQTLLDDQDAIVRMSAAETLGVFGSPEAIGPLIEALDDEHPWVRVNAAEALVAIGGDVPKDCIRRAAQRESVIRWGRRRKWRKILTALV